MIIRPSLPIRSKKGEKIKKNCAVRDLDEGSWSKPSNRFEEAGADQLTFQVAFTASEMKQELASQKTKLLFSTKNEIGSWPARRPSCSSAPKMKSELTSRCFKLKISFL